MFLLKPAAATMAAATAAAAVVEAKPPCPMHRLGVGHHHDHHYHSPSQGQAQVAMLKGHRDPRLSSWTTPPIVAEKMSEWKQAQVAAHDACKADAEIFCDYHAEADMNHATMAEVKLPTVASNKISVSAHPPLRTTSRDSNLPLMTMSTIPRPMPREAAVIFHNHADHVDEGKTIDDLMDDMMNEIVSMINQDNHPELHPMARMNAHSVSHPASRVMPMPGLVRVSPMHSSKQPKVLAFQDDRDEFVDQLISSFFGVPIKEMAPVKAQVPPTEAVRPIEEIQRRDEEDEEATEFDVLVPVHSKTIPSDATTLKDAQLDDSKSLTFVNFCKSSCHWCQSLFSTFESLAASDDFAEDVEFVFVDCDAHMDLCRNEIVFATPSLRLYHDSSKNEYEEYFGCRSEASLTAFVKDNLPKQVPTVTLTKVEEPVHDTVVLPKVSESKTVKSNKHDWFYLDAAKEIRNAESALGTHQTEEDEDEELADPVSAGASNDDIAEESSDELDTDYEYEVRSAPSLLKKSRYNDSSSKDDVTPLDWDVKEARRVSRFVEELEGMEETEEEEEVPELRRRLSRRLTELKPMFFSHDMIDRRGALDRSAILRKPQDFDYPWISMSQHLPNMGFGHGGVYEKCLVDHSFALSPKCSSAILKVNLSLDNLQAAQEHSWWMAILALYSMMIFIFVGLFLFKRVQRRKLASFHKERALRRDVLRVVHEDAALRAQVESALGRSLDKEAMTTDPVMSFKKKLGCMGMCCLTLPRMAIFVIYMCAVVTMPALIWTVLVPTLLCMALYGYAVHCCCPARNTEDYEDLSETRLGYPAAVAANAQAVPLLDRPTNTNVITITDENGSVYEAIPVI